jgi:hypothetical protein
MPRQQKAMKDVIDCDKLRVGVNNRLFVDFRMGKPIKFT